MPSRIDAINLDDLRARLRGPVIGPDDPDFDAARAIVLGGVDPRPAAIARVADAEDAASVIAYARETGVRLAVRCGGHSNAGYGVIDDSLVLDVRDLRDIDIDADGRTAWTGSGVTAAEFTSRAGEHGLAVGFGDTGSVGLGGITLGGGIGYLVRAYGLTIDSLLAAEVVTADGRIRVVDADTEPDLFWAIRGGGGNFGVATRFRFGLHPVDRIVGGLLILPATADTVAEFLALAAAAPESVSTIANVMNCPPMPFVPEEHHGQVVIMAILCHAGGGEEGERAVAPFRAIAAPIADLVHEMPYPEIYPPDDPDYHPTAVNRTFFTDTIDREVAATIVDRLETSDASLRVAQIRVLGGAMARVSADATAFAHRDGRIMVSVAAFYDGPDDRLVREAWVAALADDLRKGDDRAYVNFLGDEGETRVRAAYPGPTWDRLADIKARYDPTNLFRGNQNIPPAG